MATFKAIYDFCHGNDFQARVEVAITQAAVTVSAEATNTANHARRVTLANRVLLEPKKYADLFAVGVSSDTALQATPTDDAKLATAVSAVWNAYAGVD